MPIPRRTDMRIQRKSTPHPDDWSEPQLRQRDRLIVDLAMAVLIITGVLLLLAR